MTTQYEKNEEEQKQMTGNTSARFNKGKIRYDLIPTYPTKEEAKVYTYGAEGKYGPDNWRKGMRWKKDVLGPLKRHIAKWEEGGIFDDESNCHHLAMAIWGLKTLMEYERLSIGIDDRNPYDLTRMEESELKRRIALWKKFASENKIEEYNGLVDREFNYA